VGRVRIRLPGGTAALTVFQLDDIRDRYPDALFLPFRDAGAGHRNVRRRRYLEVERMPGGVVSLDFNRGITPTAPTASPDSARSRRRRTPFPCDHGGEKTPLGPH